MGEVEVPLDPGGLPGVCFFSSSRNMEVEDGSPPRLLFLPSRVFVLRSMTYGRNGSLVDLVANYTWQN